MSQFTIKPGEQHPLFTMATPTGLMSGENPRFPSAPGGHEALKADLDQFGVPYEETHGHYGAPERSIIIHGLPKSHLFALGKKYGQESVIHSENGNREAIYTNGPNEGNAHPGLLSHETWTKDQGPPEDYWTQMPHDQSYVRLHFNFDKMHPAQGIVPPDEPPQFQAPATAPQPQGPQAVHKAEAGGYLVGYFKQKQALAEAAARALAPPSKQEVGYAIYQSLKKALAQAQAPFKHPHAYQWHDGHSQHHPVGHTHGGIFVSERLRKVEPAKHPHMDTPPKMPGEHATNEQAAGKGVATYHRFALPFGHIDEAAKARGGSNLKHYEYAGKAPAVAKLLQDHGFQHYYAGGKYGKPDLANKNYNNGHLMVYDPDPETAGGATGFGGDAAQARDYTDSWRKTHELAHALVYPELNKIYGEGRRIGKLGSHRTQREAERAVHWEWLAAHKQRELNRSLGIEVPDETFNKELNTVMHDAAHRAVTGKFTEPSEEGFVPHSHKVPLETSLGMVREAARNLGLTGMHDLLKKAESEGSTEVADDNKTLTGPEFFRELHKGIKQRVTEFEQKCVELRKAETLTKVAPPGREEQVKELKGKVDNPYAVAWASYDKSKHKKAEPLMEGESVYKCLKCSEVMPGRKRREHSVEDHPKGASFKKMEKAELEKEGMDSPPDMGMAEPDMKKQGMMPTKSASTMQPPSPPPAGIAKGIGDGSLADPSTEKMHMSKGEMCKACGMAKSKDHDCDMAEKYAKGELTKGMMPAGAGGPTIGPTPGVLPDDKKPKKEGGDEGSGGDMKKAGFMGSKPPGGPAAGAMGAPPAGGGMPKMPKLPGVGKPAGAGAPKPPGGALPMPKAGPMSGPVPKTPALGAGSPAAKAELQKLDPTWSPHSKPTGPMPTPAFAPEPGVASLNPGKAKSQNLTGKAPPNQVDAIAPMAGAKPAAPAGLPPVISSAPAPGAAPAHGSLVGQTLTGSMGLPPGPGAITGLGAKPAQGVKTMTERVAAKVPPPIPAAAKGHSLSHLTSPPAAARPAPPQAAAPSLGGKKA